MQKRYADEYRKLGLNIAYYRRARGMSQLDLALEIGISRTHMSRIENCNCAVSLDVIFAIARELEIPVSKLFEFM